MITTDRRQGRQFAAALDGVAVGDAHLLPLARLATSLSSGVTIAGPSEDFRAALRQRLFAVGVGTAGRPAAQLSEAAAWRRRLVAAGAVLTISTGGIAATAVASTHALPGDRLYEVKRVVEDVQLVLAAGDLAKGGRYLSIASTRLGEVQSLLHRNAGQTYDPIVVQELRTTLSDMSEAINAGSEHFFAVYNHTTNAAVLGPLGEFVNRRTGTLTDVRGLLPVELLPKQDSLLGELRGIAARVATATGHPVAAALDHAAQASAVRPVADAPHASRSHETRDQLGKFSLAHAVPDVDATVAEARRDAEAAATTHRQPQRQSDMERNVRHLIETDLLDPDGTASIEGMPSASESGEALLPDSTAASTWRSGLFGAGSNSGGGLLGLLPLPGDLLDTVVPGSLSDGLDPTGGHLGSK